MYIGIKKLTNGTKYLCTTAYTDGRFTEEQLSKPPYNYTKVFVPDELVENIQSADFDDNLQFDINKYNARVNKTQWNEEIEVLKTKLSGTDYIANKLSEAIAKYCVSGDKTELNVLIDKYTLQLTQRQEWRKTVNELEEKVKSCTKLGEYANSSWENIDNLEI